MPEFNRNLWAPWRMDYIRSLGEEEQDGGCFLCRYWERPEADAENHVVWRGETAFVALNRFPYTNGHLLVALGSHRADLADLNDGELTEMGRMLREAVVLLREVARAEGFNVGYNLGQCAGAGLPGHLHAHVVPRWSGDTNYMAVLGDSRVIPDSLAVMHRDLVAAAERAGLGHDR